MSVLKNLNVSEKVHIIQSWSARVLEYAFNESLDADRYDEDSIDLDFNRHTMGVPNIQEIAYKDIPKQLVVKIGKVFPIIYELYNVYNNYVIFNALDGGISVSEFPYEIDVDDMIYYIDNGTATTISNLLSDDYFIQYAIDLPDNARIKLKNKLIDKCSFVLYVHRFSDHWSVEDETIILEKSKIDSSTTPTIHMVKHLFEDDEDNIYSDRFIKGIFYNALTECPSLVNNLKYDDTFRDLGDFCHREINKIKLLHGGEIGNF